MLANTSGIKCFTVTDHQEEFFQRGTGNTLFQALEYYIILPLKILHSSRLKSKFQTLETQGKTFKKGDQMVLVIQCLLIGKSQSKMFQTFVFFEVTKELLAHRWTTAAILEGVN